MSDTSPQTQTSPQNEQNAADWQTIENAATTTVTKEFVFECDMQRLNVAWNILAQEHKTENDRLIINNTLGSVAEKVFTRGTYTAIDTNEFARAAVRLTSTSGPSAMCGADIPCEIIFDAVVKDIHEQTGIFENPQGLYSKLLSLAAGAYRPRELEELHELGRRGTFEDVEPDAAAYTQHKEIIPGLPTALPTW